MGVHDDATGIGVTMAVPPGTAPVVHLIAGTPTLVMVLNAILAGAIVAIAAIWMVHAGQFVPIIVAVIGAAHVLGGAVGSVRPKNGRKPRAMHADCPTNPCVHRPAASP